MKANRVLRVIVIILILALVGVLAGSGMYLKEQYNRTTYFADTTVNGYDASGKTPEDVLSLIVADYTSSKLTLTEQGQTALTGMLSDYGYTIDEDMLLESLQGKLNAQKSSILVLIGSLMNASSYTVTVPFVFSQDTFQKKVNASALSSARIENINASLEYNEKENEYYIKNEVQGTTFADQDLQDYVKQQIDAFVSGNNPNKDLEISFPEEIYIAPEITKEDTELNSHMNAYNAFCKAVVTYTFGDVTEKIDWNTIQNWIFIQDGQGMLSEEKVREYVINTEANYNTLHYDRTFHTSLGTDIVIPSALNDYGYRINEDAETAQLALDIQSNTEVTREPIYYETNSSYGNPLYYKRSGRDDLAGTYVEVNLTRQHLWFYKDGNLIVESDLVSGNVSKDNATMTGAFPLAYKESPSVLVGEDAADGYRTEVQYWMPFYDGQGLHDASWRSSFGGNIYLTNGSHGCVNLPPSVAKTIYENIDAGVAIILYE